MFPAPKIFVFYDSNNQSESTHRILKLSDSFRGDSSALEIIVHSLNINLAKNSVIVKKCSYLQEYSNLISYVKFGISKNWSRRNSIFYAIQRCIDENVMKDYLLKKREEFFSMLDLQWNFDDAKQTWLEQGIEQGIKTGVEFVAINMIQAGLPFDQIQKFTQLSLDKISELAKLNLKNP